MKKYYVEIFANKKCTKSAKVRFVSINNPLNDNETFCKAVMEQIDEGKLEEGDVISMFGRLTCISDSDVVGDISLDILKHLVNSRES